jgi:hypothetical protein
MESQFTAKISGAEFTRRPKSVVFRLRYRCVSQISGSNELADSKVLNSGACVTATLEFDGLSVDWWRRLANGRWSLCLGAGINGQLMPDWLDLTRRVVNQTAAAYSAHYSAPGLHHKKG